MEDLRAYVEGSLRAGVMQRLAGQILSGDGQAPNLVGLFEVDTQPVAYSNSILETASKAVSALQANEIAGGVFVLSSAMWEPLELMQAGPAGEFVLGGPSTAPASACGACRSSSRPT